MLADEQPLDLSKGEKSESLKIGGSFAIIILTVSFTNFSYLNVVLLFSW